MKSNVRLFADDCSLYRLIRSLADQLCLQDDLNSLQDWAQKWCMNFNPSKSTVRHINRLRCKAYQHDYQLKGETLVTSKASSTLGFLCRNLKKCPPKLKETAYISMVRFTLEYSCAIWDPFQKKDIDKFNQIHRSAARFVTSNYSRKASVSTMLKSLGWEDLQSRQRNARLTLFYKILNRHVKIPVSDGLVPADERTRGANNKNYKHIRSATSVFLMTRRNGFPNYEQGAKRLSKL